MKKPIIVEIMTKKDCHLCDIAKETVRRVLRDYPAASLCLTDIEYNPALLEAYREKIPVVLIDGEEHFVYTVHETTLRKKLDEILEKDQTHGR